MKSWMRWLERFTQQATDFVSSPWGTLAALGLIAVWLASVPVVGWSPAWSYVDGIFTASSFLLLFLLQRGQTKSTLAMQVKLNELLAAVHRASPQLINVENKTEEEVRDLHDRFQRLQEKGPGSHSIEEEMARDERP
jgi:low affinity Fe/Cu permease